MKDEKKQGMVEKILIFRQLSTHITLHIAYIVRYWYQVLSKHEFPLSSLLSVSETIG